MDTNPLQTQLRSPTVDFVHQYDRQFQFDRHYLRNAVHIARIDGTKAFKDAQPNNTALSPARRKRYASTTASTT